MLFVVVFFKMSLVHCCLLLGVAVCWLLYHVVRCCVLFVDPCLMFVVCWLWIVMAWYVLCVVGGWLVFYH